MSDQSSSKPASGKRPWIRVIGSVVACIALLATAAWASYTIFATEPEAEREGATRKTAALVETIVAERGSYRPTLEVLGRVEAAREVLLSSQVAGRVIAIEPGFVPGGIVEVGEPLLRLDPADYEQMLTMRESELRMAEADLKIERGRQQAAQREYELLGESVDAANRSLVLREPQIASIEARVKAARAALQRAQLDLDRTTIRAPFDAQILSRDANIGSQLSTSDTIGRLVGAEEYWIIASVPMRDLRWLRFADEAESPSTAVIKMPTAWGKDAGRTGTVTRLIGTLDSQTRLARVLITVPDPLARENDGPALLLDAIVQVGIEGRLIEDVVRIDRDFLRQRDTVWIKEDGQLVIREVEVVYEDAEFAYIRSGIDAGEMIVTTSLATVTGGLPLRRADAPASTADDAGHTDSGANPDATPEPSGP